MTRERIKELRDSCHKGCSDGVELANLADGLLGRQAALLEKLKEIIEADDPTDAIRSVLLVLRVMFPEQF